jgi:hypothetical protein
MSAKSTTTPAPTKAQSVLADAIAKRDALAAAKLEINASILALLQDGQSLGAVQKATGATARKVKQIAEANGIDIARQGRKLPAPGTPEHAELIADLDALSARWGGSSISNLGYIHRVHYGKTTPKVKETVEA